MNHIKETIEAIKNNNNIALSQALDILEGTTDYFAKHKATTIKRQCEDTERMLASLEQILKLEAI